MASAWMVAGEKAEKRSVPCSSLSPLSCYGLKTGAATLIPSPRLVLGTTS